MMDLETDEEIVDDPGIAENVSPRPEENPPKKKVCKKNEEPSIKKFQHSWLQLTEFKGWLEPVPSDAKCARCGPCDIKLKAGKSELMKHAASNKHKDNVKTKKKTQTIQQSFAKKTGQQMHEDKVKAMEVHLAAFYATNNIAFATSDELVTAIKSGATDSAIVKDLALSRNKCSAIVRNVIGKTETEELAEEIRKTNFCALVDESTDVANKKTLCVLVRYRTPRKVRTKLLELIQLDAHDCSGEALWTAFKACLAKHEIPVKNIIGLACDNAFVMVGCHDSFWTRLKEECPWAMLFPCLCHTSALIFKSACAELPSFVENLLRNVSSYINCSPKRSAQLQDFQELYEENLDRILKLSGTRWLVLQPCVRRFLDHWDSLYAFFRTTVRESPKDREADAIFQEMSNPYTKAYLYFLDYVLNYSNEFNASFQAREVMVHKVTDESLKLLKKFSQNFLQPRELHRLATANVSNPSNFLPIDKVYLGPECQQYLAELKIPPGTKPTERAAKEKELKEHINTVRVKCLNFYVKAAKEIQSRLPINDQLLREMAFIDPSKLLSPKFRVQDDGLSELTALTSHFKAKLNLNPNALAHEWRTVHMDIDDDSKEKILGMPVEEAWTFVGDLKKPCGEALVPELTKLADNVMCLAEANAESERVYSVVTDTKTKKRNKLGIENLNAIAVVRSSFQDKGIKAKNFQVKDAHLRKFNSSMYD